MVSGSGIYAREVVVDARHMLGRLSSILAKELLNGQRVTIVSYEETYLSGGLVSQKMKYITAEALDNYLTDIQRHHEYKS
ncbi:Ribosomal protein L13 [Cynara cardunculus var. scolymus]|uniref:Ribosomal protein L13 n=1 Tax=Cynara cardunculus var. scolymus TaxID=59895 RepID=A0A103XBR9_CYNCS|nr:Ribosomal protein L13 [Cynara cardunculus var. scolymus]